MSERPEFSTEVVAFVSALPAARATDATQLASLMTTTTGEPAVMWGSSILGFGRYHYRYATGREGDTVAVGFAPRKAALTIYLCGYLDGYADLLEHLGPHTAGKGCLYVKRLSDVNLDVLREIVVRSYRHAAELDAS